MDDASFIQKVKDDMEHIGSTRNINNIGDQFAVWFGSEVMREDIGKVIDVYHIGGSHDEKIDLGICDDEHEVIYVVQCKYSGNPLSGTFDKDLIDEASNALKRAEVFPDCGNTKRKEFVAEMSASKGRSIRCMAVGFGIFGQEVHQYAIDNRVEIWDYEKIKHRYTYLQLPSAVEEPEVLRFSIQATGVEHDDAYTDLSRHPDISSQSTEDFSVYSLFLDIKDVYEAVRQWNDGLFQENLRFRLQKSSDSGIGKEIRETVKLRNEDLCILNNGLTITCIDATIRNSEMEIVSPQIVNGCQTSWAIYEACQDLKKAGRLDEIQGTIHAKIVMTRNEELKEGIRMATNLQNPIRKRDEYAKDPIQDSLAKAFLEHDPKILWDYRDGLQEAIVRQNRMSQFDLGYNRRRVIDNWGAGQLYLALLGKPYYCKDKKKDIFEDDDIYRTIFCYDQDSPTRYDNERLGLEPTKVFLRTGNIKYFVEDIIFAFGVEHLADAYKTLYRERLNAFPIAEKGSEAFRTLQEGHDFLRLWQYYVVAAFNYIVEEFSSSETDRKNLRESLVGDEIDLFWNGTIYKEFRMETNISSYQILDENEPSSKFPLFSKWITSLAYLMHKVFLEAKSEEGGLKSKSFIDHRPRTYDDLIKEVVSKVGAPAQVRDRWFPQTI